jgi:hypothetical protein
MLPLLASENLDEFDVDFIISLSEPETFCQKFVGIHPAGRTGKLKEIASLFV